MSKRLYLIDGHAQIYRAYYAPFRPLTSPSGEPTRATHVFCQALFNLIRERRPDYLAMALDVSDETVFRRDIYPQYKAHRQPPPEDLAPQKDRIVSIVQAMGIPVFSKPGFEADDLMATIVERLTGTDVDVFLVSKDKDLEQLLGDHVFLYDMGSNAVIDAANIEAMKGYPPSLSIDVQTLSGDGVDNIPGAVGVGAKTAAKLVVKYGSAEAVIAHADDLTPRLRDNLREFAPRLDVTRLLVTLRRDVDFPFDLDDCRFEGVPVQWVAPIFDELGFNRLREQLTSFDDDGANRGDAAPSSAAVTGTAPAASLPGVYQLVDTEDKLDALCSQLAGQPMFAFDTETTGLTPAAAKLVGISICWKPGEAYYIPLRAAVGDSLPTDAVLRRLKRIFEDPTVRKVGHNIKYDIVALRQIGIETAGAAFDTLIASFLLDPLRRSHGLDALALDLLGHKMIPISDLIGKGRHQTTIDQLDSAMVREYAAEDADFTWRLKDLLAPRIEGSPLACLFSETEMPLVEVLAEMEHNGVALDAGHLRRMSADLSERMDGLRARIHREAGYAFNIDSPSQLATVLFDERGLSVVRRTKTGRSTDADTLEALAASGDPVPALVLEYRELSKLKGTYVDPLPGMVSPRTGRIHTSFHITGAVTGRLSSSDPNLQNIPVRTEVGRRIREAFVAGSPDNVLLAADYSQIELRILAHYCRDRTLIDAFQSGRDIHRFVAAQVNDVAMEDVTPEQRSRAKAVNFGIIYGQTPFGLAKSLGITQAEARRFIDAYFARYPGIREFIDRCIDDARKKGYVETILGRRRPVAELRSRNRGQIALGERIAVNTVIQGSAADLIKRAMIDIHRTIKSRPRPTRMLIQVHDELVFETPLEHVEEEAAMIREKMTHALDLDVPIGVDVSWGQNWLAAKAG